MKIELITTKQFIEQAECYFRNYMTDCGGMNQRTFIIFLTINII